MSKTSRGGVYEKGERAGFGSHGGSPQGDRRGSRRAARRAGTLVGQAQGGSDPAVIARRRPGNPLARTGRDRRDPVRLAGSVPGGRRSELESAGGRCRERRDAAAEIAGRRSEHEQRTAARKDPPHGGRTPFGLAEVEAMSRAASPFTERRYGVVRVTREWEMARSSFYHQHTLAMEPDRLLRRRGPKTAWSDAVLLGKICAVLAESPFYGEGHRKVWARL